MMRAMKGTRIAAATELLLEAKWRPMDSGSDSSSLRSVKSQSKKNQVTETQFEALSAALPDYTLSGSRAATQGAPHSCSAQEAGVPRAARLPPRVHSVLGGRVLHVSTLCCSDGTQRTTRRGG